jgi:hypothetical protein
MGMGMNQEKSGRRRPEKRIAPWQRKRRRILFVLFLVGLVISVWLVWRLGKKSEFNEALREANSLGLATMRGEYESRFGDSPGWWEGEQAPGEDSPYHKAWNSYQGMNLDMLRDFPAFSRRHASPELKAMPYPDAVSNLMREMTDSNETTLRDLHEATLTGATAPWSKKLMIELLCAAACARAHDGDGGTAFQALDDGFVLLRHGDREGGEGARALGLYGDGDRLLMALASALRRVRFTDAQLGALQVHFQAGDWRAQRALEDKQRRSDDFTRNRAYYDSSVGLLNILTGFHEAYLSYDLRAWSAGQGLSGLPLSEQDAVIDSYSEEPWKDWIRRQAPASILDVVEVALGVVRYAQEHQEMPPTLDVLVPDYCAEVPVDFWSGEPLRYEVDGLAFAVYSVGRNRSDDGASSKKDIVFETELPALGG